MSSYFVTQCKRCHGEFSSNSNAYSWMQSQCGFPLSGSNSCLTCYGGNMPTSGSCSSTEKSDIAAWDATGSQNN